MQGMYKCISQFTFVSQDTQSVVEEHMQKLFQDISLSPVNKVKQKIILCVHNEIRVSSLHSISKIGMSEFPTIKYKKKCRTIHMLLCYFALLSTAWTCLLDNKKLDVKISHNKLQT